MSRKASRARMLGYVAVVALLVSAGLAGAGVFFQVVEQAGHTHPGLSDPAAGFGLAVDGAGAVLALLLAVQLMVGQRLFDLPGKRFRTTHIAMAWSVAAVAALHGLGAVIHTFQAGGGAVQIWLDVIGTSMLVVLALLFVTGYRWGPARSWALAPRVHAWSATAMAAVLAAHGVLGLVHTLTG